MRRNVLQPVRYDGEKAKALQEEENGQMCGTRLQRFGFRVGLLGSETGHQDLQIGVQDYHVGYDLREGDDEKAEDLIHGYVGADEGQQTGMVTVGVRELRPTAR